MIALHRPVGVFRLSSSRTWQAGGRQGRFKRIAPLMACVVGSERERERERERVPFMPHIPDKLLKNLTIPITTRNTLCAGEQHSTKP